MPLRGFAHNTHLQGLKRAVEELCHFPCFLSDGTGYSLGLMWHRGKQECEFSGILWARRSRGLSPSRAG